MEQKRQVQKTRHLTTYEFFEIVQVEYICAVLRARLYPKIKDKEYWGRVAEGKKQTIQTIADRNRLPSILTDSDLEAALSRRVYRDDTHPYFIYKDEQQRLSQEYLDLLYYYQKGADVRFDIGSGTQVGKILDYEPFRSYITVEVRDTKEKVNVSVSKTVRIL